MELNKLSPIDEIIIFSGNFGYMDPFLKAKQRSLSTKYAQLNYMEVGWFTQKTHIYVDKLGVNAKSSLLNQKQSRQLTTIQSQAFNLWLDDYKEEMLRFIPKQKKIVKSKKPVIFIPLQVDTDTNIQLFSPFSSMADFICFLEKWVPKDIFDIRIKLHPKAPYNYQVCSEGVTF